MYKDKQSGKIFTEQEMLDAVEAGDQLDSFMKITDAPKLPQMPTYLQPHELNEEDGTYELVMETRIDAAELKILNQHGYVYHSEQLDIDFDYQDESGAWYTGSQDIYYFTRIPK
jgi:hypothetical protein